MRGRAGAGGRWGGARNLGRGGRRSPKGRATQWAIGRARGDRAAAARQAAAAGIGRRAPRRHSR
eukprot:9033473-Pyramimonas_sp.AAC.1